MHAGNHRGSGGFGPRKSKYHPDNAYLGNDFYLQRSSYGAYSDPYTVT